MPPDDNDAEFQMMPLPKLDGSEEIVAGRTVSDFWAWALGDLRLNRTRGLLAQFLVATAVNDVRVSDDGWGAFDVLSSSEVRIEVKSSAYLQSWAQTRLSRISFGGLITHRWDEAKGYSSSPTVLADIYVFCVQTCRDPNLYDPLSIGQWDFYVLPGRVISERRQRSMSLATVRMLAGEPIPWDELNSRIETITAQERPESTLS